MVQVSHRIAIGSTVLSGNKTRLLDLRTAASLTVPVNVCRLVLSPPDDLSLAPQDPIEVELGYEADRSLVFTGLVSTVDWQIDRVTVYGMSAFQALVQNRFNLLYEKSKAGDMVSDVVGRLGLSPGAIANGLEFPVYVLGDNQSVYDHLQTLAQQCGFDLYANPEDQVVFEAYQPRETHEFQYGVNILSLKTADPAPAIAGVEIYGESPTSLGQGPDAYAWLTKQAVQGTAGDPSGVVQRFIDPTVRTLETAGQVATALLEKVVQKQRGELRVLGNPLLKLGDAIHIADMPLEVQNGTFKITQVEHILNPRQGFYTVMGWEEA
ncbi:MAG: hypothetical protein WCD18_05320 [Thermosynechococcaceae cyanobacterium]